MLSINGADLCSLPLLEHMRRLRAVLSPTSRVLYLDHIEARGVDLFRAACDRDLEGIVGKWAHGRYNMDRKATSWLKIRSGSYSQMEGRRELFEMRRTTAALRRTAPPVLELA